MTLFTTSRPTISVKSLSRFPARVTADTGLAVTVENGTYNFGFDFEGLNTNTSIATPSNWTTLVYNTQTEQYEQVRLDALVDYTITPRRAIGNTNATIAADDKYVALTAALTTPRTWTLPAANSVSGGANVIIQDEVGGVSSTNTLTIQRAGSDTLNGGTSVIITKGYDGFTLYSDGVSRWSAVSEASGLSVTSGKTLNVSNTLTLTGTDGSSVALGAGGTVAYTANKLSAFAATSSSELAGVISDETGSGALVFGTGPTITSATLVTPTLGTPSGGTLTNCSGLPLTTGVTGVLPEANGGTGRTTLSFPNVTGNVITSADSGTVTPTMLSQKLTVMSSQATTSGSTKDFTSIPSWVRKITVVLNGVSHSSGTSQAIGVQLGTSGGIVTSGYASGGAYTGTGAVGVNTSTYFTTGGTLSSSDILHGIMTLANITSNTWVASFSGGLSNDTYGYIGGGSIALSGTLDRVRVLTSASGTFDAGAVTVIYE